MLAKYKLNLLLLIAALGLLIGCRERLPRIGGDATDSVLSEESATGAATMLPIPTPAPTPTAAPTVEFVEPLIIDAEDSAETTTTAPITTTDTLISTPLKGPIVVGSRDFTEQFILAEITKQLLINAGFEVIDRTGLGGTNTAHAALVSDDIDIYWEYTGTALAEFHKIPAEGLPADSKMAWETAAALDAIHHNLTWLDYSAFNDTYTLMIRDGSLGGNMQSIEDLAAYINENDEALTFCVENDFYSRNDGFFPLQERYGFSVDEENILLVAYDQLYEDLRAGDCDVAEGFSTDGRISAWGFKNLADTLQFFPAYNAAAIVRQPVLEQYPEVGDRLSEVAQLLDNETMTHLNARVDLGADGVRNSGDEESLEAVANGFLERVGLAGSRPRIVVGSRDFTEQFILAEITMQYLKTKGFDVVDRTGLGGIQTGHAQLRSGGIDILWEYTGTALAEFHRFPSNGLPADSQLAWETIASLDKLHHDLVWRQPSVFNATNTLVIRPNHIPVPLTTIEDLADYMNANGSPLTLCVENDFFGRNDGLFPLLDHYGFTFLDENIELVATDQLYESLRDGLCDVAEGYTTDGRTNAWEFQNLVDSKAFFSANNAAPIVRQAVLDEQPDVALWLDEIGGYIDDEMMTWLNARVDVGADGVRNSGDEESVAAVAASFLDLTGLTSNRPKVTVGSLNFTEQYLLGYLTKILLEKNGYRVEDQIGQYMGTSGYEALRAGTLDLYWDYTGSVLTHQYQRDIVPTNADFAWQEVAELDAEQGLTWLNSGQFNDTFTLLINPTLLGIGSEIVTIDDLANFMNTELDTPLRLCVEEDFVARRDGLYALQDWYGFAFRDEYIQIISLDEVYDNLRIGACDVAVGFRTDGRVSAWGLQPLVDSAEFFPAYNAAPIVRSELLAIDPAIADVLGQLGGYLTDETMTRLNAQVDLGFDRRLNTGDENSAEMVAETFLCDVGLIHCGARPSVVEAEEADVGVDSAETTEPEAAEAAAAAGLSCENIVLNGGFEETNGWVLPITRASASYSTAQAHSGTWSVELGAAARGTRLSFSGINQLVNIPRDVDSAEIRFWFYPIALDSDEGDELILYIYDRGQQVVLERNDLPMLSDQSWVEQTFDLSRYRGEEITLNFIVMNDGDGIPTTMFVDDVSLTICRQQ